MGAASPQRMRNTCSSASILVRRTRVWGSERGRPWLTESHGHPPGILRDHRRPGRFRHGSTFTPGGLARRTRGGGVMRILIVDDEPDVVQSLRLGFTLESVY